MNQNSPVPAVLIPNLFVLLAIAVGLVSDSPGLRSSRPPEGNDSTANPAPRTDPTRTPARLWEDPLAPGSFPTLPAKDGEPPAQLVLAGGHITLLAPRPDSGTPVLPRIVLLVPLSGLNYADQREVRLRSRYAIISALGRADFIPCDRENLRRTHLQIADPANKTFQPTSPRFPSRGNNSASAGSPPTAPPRERPKSSWSGSATSG